MNIAKVDLNLLVYLDVFFGDLKKDACGSQVQ